ncbi:large exoprotein [Microbacterium invictum]|uniref:Large exoprotein n=1 Tax=Microbacterium invictum TaxID=515415 RepID=A0ABZ0VDB1_9MICO|nr:large exoprotein [Microbacterium invictum]WQB71623.1 large exoprotein [Microbacterium invictum]
MGGQVLGGGVIVLVAVLLWLVYLLPSWHSRRQFDAAERNAVRLNQALRVLAETSETPAEVRLELSARTAAAQQKLAKRAMAEREDAALEQARVDLERARAEKAAAKAAPEARQARARRRVRLVATSLGFAGLGLAGWGAWLTVSTGAIGALVGGLALVILSIAALAQMARVAARVARRSAASAVPVARTAPIVQDVPLPVARQRAAWAPRELPRPLTVSAGSQAAAVRDVEDAREELRQAAVAEALRVRAEAAQPPSIEVARAARAAQTGPDFARMGFVDDAEIEDHVRRLLQRRAAGA